MIKASASILHKLQVSVTMPVSIINTGGDGGEVEILDQNNDVIATVEAPGTYNVIVLSGIVDNGGPYSNSIIDNG